MSRRLQYLLTIAGAILFAAFSSLPAFGQTEADTRANEKDLEERVFNLSLLRAKGKSTGKHSDPQAILALVQADFNRLQVVNNDLVDRIGRSSSLDLDLVMKSAAEINTLAQKLMTNLSQTKTDKTKRSSDQVLTDYEQLRSALMELDKTIGEFITNPVFKVASPDDEKLGVKALRDLDRIIKLSSQAHASAEKFIRESQS
jgi:hypothetical protein